MYKNWYRFSAGEITVPSHTLIHDVNLELEVGEKVLLIGDNGSGKSTLLQYLAGNLMNNFSQLEIAGLPIAAIPAEALAKHRHVVFQTDIPYPVFSVAEYLEIVSSQYQSDKTLNSAEREIFGISSLEDKRLQSLSGGEWMRVRLAAAWLSQAKILFLDEADAPLDKNYRKQIFQYLLTSANSVVAVSHNAEVQSFDWDRKYLISEQRLVQL